MNESRRKKIKNYFEGKPQTLPIVLMIVGIVTMAAVVGIFLFLGGLVWFLVNKFRADLSGESEVDKAVQYEIKRARERAMQKLNLEKNQWHRVFVMLGISATVELLDRYR